MIDFSSRTNATFIFGKPKKCPDMTTSSVERSEGDAAEKSENKFPDERKSSLDRKKSKKRKTGDRQRWNESSVQ